MHLRVLLFVFAAVILVAASGRANPAFGRTAPSTSATASGQAAAAWPTEDGDVVLPDFKFGTEIGRASCRERV